MLFRSSLLGFDREPERPVFILEPQTSVGTGSWTYLGRVCYEFPDTIRSEFRLEIYQKTAHIGTWIDTMIIEAGKSELWICPDLKGVISGIEFETTVDKWKTQE